MKNKILFIIIILLALAIGIGIGVYVLGDKCEKPAGSIYGPEAKEGGAVLEKEGFTINMPEGWAEIGTPSGVSAMVVNVNEEITDLDAQKINFQSYFSVVYDTLSGKSNEEYLQSIKDSLNQVVPGVLFVDEKEGKIDDRDAYFIEAEFKQRGVDFKILLVIIKGGEDVWIVTFNTPKSNWEGYKDLFYQTADSFQLKQ